MMCSTGMWCSIWSVGSDLSDRLRAESAGRRSGGELFDPASGNPIPSPAILEKIGTGFRAAVRRFAADNEIPVVHFEKNDRKIDVMRPYLAAQAATGRSGVAAIGVAQEFARVFLATKHTGQTTGVCGSRSPRPTSD